MRKFLYEKLRDHMFWPPKENMAQFLALALCGEVGEVANLLKKDWRGDTGDRRSEIEKELADVGNYLGMLAIFYGIDLEQAMLDKLNEVEKRPTWKAALEKMEIEKKMSTTQKWGPTNGKESNPKDLVGMNKVPFSVIPIPVHWEVGLALLEGALKYGAYNWRDIGVRGSAYYDAVVARHLASWWEGEDIDPDSGIHHISKAIAGLYVLRDSIIQGNWVDDRPRKSDPSLLQNANNLARALRDKHQGAKKSWKREEQMDPVPLTPSKRMYDGLGGQPTVPSSANYA